VLLAGSVTWAEAEPEAQFTVAGSPARVFVVDENVQLAALVTRADSVTCPPAEDTDCGLAVNEEIDGAAAGDTVTLTAVALTVFEPTADSPKE
jgi:hypothetical protein